MKMPVYAVRILKMMTSLISLREVKLGTVSPICYPIATVENTAAAMRAAVFGFAVIASSWTGFSLKIRLMKHSS